MKRHRVNRVNIAILAGVIWVAMSGIAAGAETFSLYVENDGGVVKPLYRTDRHYSAGDEVVFTHQPDVNLLKDYSRWNGFGKDDGEVNTAVGYFAGQNLYTPDNIDNPAERARHDMQYAGWAYWGIFAQRASDNQMEELKLNMGLIGPIAQGAWTQDLVHKLMGAGQATGWDTQLGDEFHTDLTWLRRQRVSEQFFKRTENFDTHLEYGATVGTLHRNAEAGIVFRYGLNLPNDFGPGRLEAPASACISKPAETQSAYIFTRIGGRLVEYDRFLSGLTTEPAVGVLQAGIAYRYKSFEVSYSQTFMTREYKEQANTDSYGAVNMTYRF